VHFVTFTSLLLLLLHLIVEKRIDISQTVELGRLEVSSTDFIVRISDKIQQRHQRWTVQRGCS